MKKMFLILVVVHCSFVLEAGIITVDNKVPRLGQFETLQAAHDVANIGDIIYIYPSPTPYQAITVTKQITISGNGFITTDPNLYTSKITGELKVLADGVTISSLDGTFPIIIDGNNVTIQRCRLCNILANPNHNSIKIIQNYLTSSSAYEYCLNIKNSNGIMVSNNIIFADASSIGGSGYPCCIYLNTSNGIISNNLLSSSPFQNTSWNGNPTTTGYAIISVNCSSLLIQYNLLIQGHNSTPEQFFKYNISSSALRWFYHGNWVAGSGGYEVVDMFPTSNNTTRIDFSTIFINGYHIIPGSIASSEGVYKTELLFDNAKEVGIYGGDTPYIDGGYPDIPVIYLFEAGSYASRQNGVKVKIKAKSNK